jgi:hypothetical protein
MGGLEGFVRAGNTVNSEIIGVFSGVKRSWEARVGSSYLLAHLLNFAAFGGMCGYVARQDETPAGIMAFGVAYTADLMRNVCRDSEKPWNMTAKTLTWFTRAPTAAAAVYYLSSAVVNAAQMRENPALVKDCVDDMFLAYSTLCLTASMSVK